MSRRRDIPILVMAVVLAAFVSLYPVMDCEDNGCPDAVHSALGAAAATCVVGIPGAVFFPRAGTLRRSSALLTSITAMFSQTCTSELFRPPRG